MSNVVNLTARRIEAGERRARDAATAQAWRLENELAAFAAALPPGTAPETARLMTELHAVDLMRARP